jgi:hypothetical protein
MAISRKPKPDVSEAAIKAVIEKGGSVARDKLEAGKKNLQLRLDTNLIAQIDQARQKKSVPPSRHTWILEAIHEKLSDE